MKALSTKGVRERTDRASFLLGKRPGRLRVPGVALLAAITAACGLVAPDADVRPRIETLNIPSVWNAPRGPILLVAAMTDSATVVAIGEEVPVRVRIGQEVHEVLLSRTACSPTHYCREIEVYLKPSRTFDELDATLVSLDAAVLSQSFSPSLGSRGRADVYVFSGSTQEAAAVLTRHDAVASAAISPMFYVQNPFPRSLRAFVPARNLESPLPSAVVQLIPGDSIVVSYTQPDGATVTRSSVVPDRNR
jgi:hypothetical protein